MRTSVPTAFVADMLDEVGTTLRLTSASSRATRISRRASAMFSSVSVPWPRRDLKATLEFVCEVFKHGQFKCIGKAGDQWSGIRDQKEIGVECPAIPPLPKGPAWMGHAAFQRSRLCYNRLVLMSEAGRARSEGE